MEIACSISAAACKSPAARAFSIPSKEPTGCLVLAGLGVRLAELLVGRHLVVGPIGDQLAKLPALSSISPSFRH